MLASPPAREAPQAQEVAQSPLVRICSISRRKSRLSSRRNVAVIQLHQVRHGFAQMCTFMVQYEAIARVSCVFFELLTPGL